jgi:hypothetical protein
MICIINHISLGDRIKGEMGETCSTPTSEVLEMHGKSWLQKLMETWQWLQDGNVHRFN